MDNFCLFRKINQPELVFNLNRDKDAYFEIDSANYWQFTQSNECFICDKQSLTIIVYDQT